MKMVYFKGKQPNFGDDLNPWMWPRFFPGLFDDDDSEAFIGIGSIIGMGDFKDSTKKVVFGAAYVPEYHKKPDTTKNYDFRFVRGPRTARLLGLDPSLAIGDPATLLHLFLKDSKRTQEVISFIPHWESIDRGNWQEACKRAGLNFIDSRGDVDTVLGEILRSKFVITEAMHGAIVADALRVPWIPLVPVNRINRTKWQDWADTLKLSLPKYRLWPSGIGELRLWKLKHLLLKSPLAPPLQRLLTHIAAYRLKTLSKKPQCLSDDAVLQDVLDRMLQKVDELRQEKKIA